MNNQIKKHLGFGLIFLIGLCVYVTSSYATDMYFLCGPDEDGCFDDDYTSCICIPQDDNPNTPYCLYFHNLEFVPFSKKIRCPQTLIFNDQGSCLATIFHSTPTTPCHVKTRDFCITHQIEML